MKKTNHTCIICGNKYYWCSSCGHGHKDPLWYGLFDSERCKDIYEAIMDYESGRCTANEAAEKLKDVKLSDIPGESFRNSISNIRKAAKAKAKRTKNSEEIIKGDASNEPDAETGIKG